MYPLSKKVSLTAQMHRQNSMVAMGRCDEEGKGDDKRHLYKAEPPSRGLPASSSSNGSLKQLEAVGPSNPTGLSKEP